MLAGSLSYFSMMAVVPFCLFLVSVFGQVLGSSPGLYHFFHDRLTSLFPAATDNISKAIARLISHRGFGGISLVLYAVLSYQLFASIEKSLNAVFKIRKRRSFLHSVMVSVVAVTMILLVVGISFAAASVIPLVSRLKPYLPGIQPGILAAYLIVYVVPFLMVLMTLTAIYRVFPRRPIPIVHALKGACFTTIFLEIAKHVFTWYVVSVAPMGRLYGSLTAFVVFLLWMFYSSCLFLIGAEIVYNLGRSKKVRGEA